MNEIIQENLLYLYNNKKEMLYKIQNYLNNTESKKCKLIIQEDGKVNLDYIVDGVEKHLYTEEHSDVDLWIKKNNKLLDGKHDVIMYGLGLTHHLAKLIETNSELNFYIFEPSLDVFVEALKVINIKDIFEHPQVKLFELGDNEEEIKGFQIKVHIYSEYEKIDIYIPFYTDIDLLLLRDFYKTGYTVRKSQLLELSFENEFGRQPYLNTIRNLEVVNQTTSINIFENKYRGCSALVVGAGPSLELDIEAIKNNADKFIIIAAGSSIQALLYHGIKPHFVVSIDPGDANARVFDNLETEDIPLIYVPQIHPGVLHKSFARQFYSLLDADTITNYLFSNVQINYKFISTITVTGTAIQFAKFIGAAKIILTGQDLSFPSNNYYAKGATHLDSDILENEIISSTMQVENVSGGFNRTNLSMKTALQDIEELIASIKKVVFINSSSLGAKIKGTTYIPFSKVIDDTHSSFNVELESIKSIPYADTIVERPKIEFIERIHLLIENCDYIIGSNKKSLKIVEKIDQIVRKNPNKAMNLLANLEEEFSSVTEHQLYKSVVTRWIVGLTLRYDQQVIQISEEKNMVAKSKLLNNIVTPYIKVINETVLEIREEFSTLLSKLEAKQGN